MRPREQALIAKIQADNIRLGALGVRGTNRADTNDFNYLVVKTMSDS